MAKPLTLNGENELQVRGFAPIGMMEAKTQVSNNIIYFSRCSGIEIMRRSIRQGLRFSFEPERG